MAHFAKIDENGIVVDILVVDNSVLEDENGNEDEQKGIDFLRSLFPDERCDWKQTSYNTKIGINVNTFNEGFRKNYASRGGTYDYVRNAFIGQKYNDNVVLNEVTCDWFDPFIANQVTPEDQPDDLTDYGKYTSEFIPENWEWDSTEKTWKNTQAHKKVLVSYVFDKDLKQWVEK